MQALDFTSAANPYAVMAARHGDYSDSASLLREQCSFVDRASNYAIRGFTAAAVMLTVTHALSPSAMPGDPSVIGRIFAPIKLISALPSHFVAAYEEMESYRQLRDGWDGPGSRRPLSDAIDDAQAFLRSLPDNSRSPESTVAADGSIGWFWKVADINASVTFPGRQRFAYYAHSKATGSRSRGSAFFDRQSIPDDFLEIIKLA